MNCKENCEFKAVHGTKYCPTHKCRNSECLNMVNKVDDKLNFYCMDHMRCGREVTKSEDVCSGCLETFQDSNHDDRHLVRASDTNDY